MTQGQSIDFGSVQIHKKVLAEIIFSAVKGVEGIQLISKTLGDHVFGFLGQKKFPGIGIKVGEKGDISLEIKVIVQYGVNIPDVARQTQDVIKAALNKTVDINLQNININVQGVEKGVS